MQIILKGNPTSTGNIYKTMCRGNFPRTYMTHKGRQLKEDYKKQAEKQWKDGMWLCPIKMIIDIYFSQNRKYDWDNFHKLSMDSLTGICYEDDSQIQEALVRKHYDKENPRIEIDIIQM